jgi:hypothetical protein
MDWATCRLLTDNEKGDYLQVSFPRPGPLISFSEMDDY